MVAVIYLRPGVKEELIERFRTLEEAIKWMRNGWPCFPESGNYFFVGGKGYKVLAQMVKPADDLELCHTVYANGHTEDHYVSYTVKGTIITEI